MITKLFVGLMVHRLSIHFIFLYGFNSMKVGCYLSPTCRCSCSCSGGDGVGGGGGGGGGLDTAGR